MSALHFHVSHGSAKVVLSKDIDPNQTFLQIPGELCISSVSALLHPLIGAALDRAYQNNPPVETSKGLSKLVANVHYVRMSFACCTYIYGGPLETTNEFLFFRRRFIPSSQFLNRGLNYFRMPICYILYTILRRRGTTFR